MKHLIDLSECHQGDEAMCGYFVKPVIAKNDAL